MQKLTTTVVVALLYCGYGLPAGAQTPDYLNPDLPVAQRVDDLIERMTLEEKISMMDNSTPGVPRLDIPRYDWWSEALHGVANAGYATVFPQAIGLAAMWDDSLLQDIARVTGIEGRAKFNSYIGTPLEGEIFRGLTFWSPNINIFRDPRWGRGQETYGEDPHLTGRLGVAFVRGLQGDHPDYLLGAAGAKHFAVHSGPEPLRHDFDASPPERDLHETYLPAFEAVVREADVEIVMPAYNAVYGVPASISPLLYGLLDEWGFDGHVTSDCGSVGDLHRTYEVAEDAAEANALALKAGMNLRCGEESANLLEAVQRGLVTEVEIDEGLAPLIRTMFRLGFFDPQGEVPFNAIAPTRTNAPEHGALALQAARESMVLLKNEGLLPLDARSVRRVAVVGPNATSEPVLVGNYNGIPYAPVTVLAGLRAALEPAGVEVTYAHGTDYAMRPTETRTIASGWFHGSYFDNPDLAGEPAARRTERPLNFDLGSRQRFGGLPEGVPDEGISALWTGHLMTTLGGDYELVVRGRGGFRLIIDGEAVIDSWTPPPGLEGELREVRVTHPLPDNATLPLRLEYTQGDGPVAVTVEWKTPPVDAGIDEAVAAAEAADVIVYVGGISGQLEGEAMPVDYDGFVGGDRESIELPALQQRVLDALHATGRPIVMVNMSGSAMALPWADANVEAILQAWYPGQAGGTAVADVLVGTYNPAGRLPVTFYRSTDQLRPFEDYAMDGRTYRYFQGDVLFPFGHGLSYTTFDYANLRTSSEALPADGSLTVAVDVTNTGERAGDEVVQLYVAHPESAVERPLKELKGFERIMLEPGETRTVTFSLDASELAYWDPEHARWVVEAAPVEVLMGASSADIRQRATVDILGPAEEPATNPIIWADVPDPAVIRVGDTYYMSSTTMHLSPGVPIMKSDDLVNWELVGYAYDTLAVNDALTLQDGEDAYGRGSWASSLRYHDGTYYVSTFSATTGRTHVYTTEDIKKGPWKATSFEPSLHDNSLFFDDDGRTYMVYAGGDIRLVELTEDASGIKPGGFNDVIIPDAHSVAGPDIMLPAEGSQLRKIDGRYYLLNITWPRGGMRTTVVHRADEITGPYESRVVLQDEGIAQGSLIDTPEGEWYAFLFGDRGAVGRIPYLVPVRWEDGWPVMGVDGKVPARLDIPAGNQGISGVEGIVASDEFERGPGEAELPLVWQWNHNPDDEHWALVQDPGRLRLTTGRVDDELVDSRNTLTQRTFGPTSSASTAVEVSGMKDGDYAGLTALAAKYGFVGVKMEDGDTRIVMVQVQGDLLVELEGPRLDGDRACLRIDANFEDQADEAFFYYSLDCDTWTPIGEPLQMVYTLEHFMGYRFGLFNFASQDAGGFVDFNYFRLNGSRSCSSSKCSP